MSIWKRLLATLVAMTIVSLAAGLIWHSLFDARMPSYLSGVVGGLAALGVWEFLRE